MEARADFRALHVMLTILADIESAAANETPQQAETVTETQSREGNEHGRKRPNWRSAGY